MKRTTLKRNTKPIRRNSPLKRTINALKRSRVKIKPRKKHPGDNPLYLDWLRTWPCFVCLGDYCRHSDPNYTPAFEDIVSDLTRRTRAVRLYDNFGCGITEAAHVGLKGTGQRCPDREAMPLGRAHHRHPTDGGRPDSHHAGTKTFWAKHGLDRSEVFELLHRLYTAETGNLV